MARNKNLTRVIFFVILIVLIAVSVCVFVGEFFPKSRYGDGFIEVSGRIEGDEYHASSKVCGRVVEMLVEEGADVKAGDTIAVLDSPQLKAVLGQALAQLKKAESSFNLDESEYQRYRRLLDADAVAKIDFERVENKYVVSRENVEAARKEIDKVNADLGDTVIKAPVDGRIIDRVVLEGEVVSTGTPLVSMVNLDDLYLKVYLPTEKSGKVNIGDEARIFPDAFPQEPFEARVDKISSKAEFSPKNVETKIERAKLVFEIRLKVKDNSSRKLKPGMPAEAVIKIDKNAQWKSLK